MKRFFNNFFRVLIAGLFLISVSSVAFAEDSASISTISPDEISDTEPDIFDQPIQTENPEDVAPTSEPESIATETIKQDGAEDDLSGQAEKIEVDPNEGTLYAEGEILVAFEEGIMQSQMQLVIEETELEPSGEMIEGVSGNDEVVVLETDEQTTVKQAVEELNQNPLVKWAQPNYYYRLMETAADSGGQTMLNDPKKGEQWYLDSIGIYDAWNIRKVNRSVKVAVLDSGINMEHSDLINCIDKANAYDEYNDMPLTGDLTGHGTHVAGIIAAEANNGIGVAGVSYNAQIVPINVFHMSGGKAVASTSDIVAAYDRLMNIPGVRVVNMSLGGYADYPADWFVEQRINTAYRNGIATVCAGGNGDQYNVGHDWTVYPSDYDACISVVPVDASNNRPSWADYNELKDIAAPGISIVSTYENGYAALSGSSMASPVVSAVAALIFAENPSLGVDEMKEVLYSTATDLGESGKDPYYGWGKVNAAGALRKVSMSTDTKAPTLQKIEKSADPSTSPVFYVAAQGVKDDKSGVASVQFAVWSENGGQDDLRWYNAVSNGGSGWSTGIGARNHKNDTGRYQIHIYGTDHAGNRGLMGTTTIVLDHKDTKAPTLQKIEKSADPSTSPVFYVAAQGVKDDKSGVASVQFAVWSENGGQDDLKWYDGVNNGAGGWAIGVDIWHHQSNKGRYQVHIYGMDNAGNRALMGTTTMTVL